MHDVFKDALAPFLSQPNPLLRVTDAQLSYALKRIQALEADLHECREYLEKQMDVVDGDDGQPAPNKAMQLVCMIDQTLYEPEPRR